MTYWCYIIQSTKLGYENRSYCGFTIDPIRRLRQHNGELKNGAKATRNNGPWRFIVLISGFKSNNNALSCEWRLKHPDGKKIKNKKYNGIEGRIFGLNKVLCMDKWTNQCDILNCDCEYVVYIDPILYPLLNLEIIPKNIAIFNFIKNDFANDIIV